MDTTAVALPTFTCESAWEAHNHQDNRLFIMRRRLHPTPIIAVNKLVVFRLSFNCQHGRSQYFPAARDLPRG